MNIQISGIKKSVSPLCLGGWIFGEEWWGTVDRRESKAAIRHALNQGINMIDTAPIYGGGLSEKIIGNVIKEFNRTDIVLATKCGLIGRGKQVEFNLSKKSIMNEIDQSLKRLKTDYIDLYQCHWPDPHTDIEETIEALEGLVAMKKIYAYGLSNYDYNLLKKASSIGNIASVQMHYSLLERSIEKNIIPFCEKNNIPILTYGSMGGGILSGKYQTPPTISRADVRHFFYPYYKNKAFIKTSSVIDHMNILAKKIKKPLNQIALNWTLSRDIVGPVIVGCRNIDQVDQNVKTLKWKMKKEDRQFLDETKYEPV